VGTRTSAKPQRGHGFSDLRNSFMTHLLASGFSSLAGPASPTHGAPCSLAEIGLRHFAPYQFPVPHKRMTGRDPAAFGPSFWKAPWYRGISCGVSGVEHEEKKGHGPTKCHAGQQE
jgi:hypothetical protein